MSKPKQLVDPIKPKILPVNSEKYLPNYEGQDIQIFIGIDPGISGGIAAVSADGSLLGAWDMPVRYTPNSNKAEVSPTGLTLLLNQLPQLLKPGSELKLFANYEQNGSEPIFWTNSVYAIVEKVAARPGQGVVSMFGFGRSLGVAEGVLSGMEIAYDRLIPQTWKLACALGSDKNVARAMAKGLWPKEAYKFNRVKDDGRAEAALMAEVARVSVLACQSELRLGLHCMGEKAA